MEYNVQGPDGTPHVIEGPEGATDAEIIAQAQKLFQPSNLESFARGAENNFPLLNQAIAGSSAVLGDKSYSQNLAQQNQDIAAAKQAHPVPYGAGAVAGAVAPLAIPGVGEALAASPIAASAALGAAQGVGSTDIAQNPGEALKNAAVGAGTGAVAGAILPTGAGTAKDLEEFANTKGVQSLGLKPGTLGIPSDELNDLGQFAHEIGAVKGPLEQRVNNVQDIMQQVGGQIGEMGAGAQPLQDVAPYVDKLAELAKESSAIFEPSANQELGSYRMAMSNLKPGITFDELQNLKSGVGTRAFDASGEVKNDALANVYRVYKDAMKSIVDASPAEYQDAMTQYGKLKDIHSALMNQFQKAQAQGVQAKGFGMAGKLAGMVSGEHPTANLAVAGALAPAHPFMALGALTPIATNPAAMSGAARSVAGALPTVGAGLKLGSVDAVTSYLMKTLNSDPQKLGKFATPLINAAKEGGSQGIAAQHFVMASQYPEYNQMMLDRENSDGESR